MTTASTEMNATAPSAQRSSPSTPRLDLYSQIHKALRAMMFDTLERLGRLDVHDAEDRRQNLDQAERLLTQLASHLHHENKFLHTAIEARRPGAAAVTGEAHSEHLDSIDDLAAEIAALRNADAAHATAIAQRLYRHMALFVAENLEHMQVEETANNAALWTLYTDAELEALHGRLVASVAPAELMQVAPWMARASHPQELASLLAGMQAGLPPQAFDALLSQMRPQLDEGRWAKLARALGLPLAPGLVSV
jgi:hypothetical protein